MDWLGRASLDFHASSSPISFETQEDGPKTLLDVVKESTPACQLNPLLFNGHLQTCWTAVNKEAPPVHYRRRVFEAEHSSYTGSFVVDFYVPPGEAAPEEEADGSLPPRTAYFSAEELARLEARGSDDDRPMLVVLHGLSGGSHEVYLRHAIAPLLESGKWEACVVNSRGCAKSKITTGILYNARATWDTRQTVKWLRMTFPNRPLFGIGFSLGACILTNYLGEEGSNCQLKAAVACANPWNLEVSNNALKRTFMGHNLYSKVLGSEFLLSSDPLPLLNTSLNHVEERTNLGASRNEETRRDPRRGDQEIHRLRSGEDRRAHTSVRVRQGGAVQGLGVPDRERVLQGRVIRGRRHGNQDSLPGDQRDGRSGKSSSRSTPRHFAASFVLMARKQQISAEEALPYGEIRSNPYAVLCTTSMGGHLGWFEPGGGRWHSRPVARFMNYMAFEAKLDDIKTNATDNGKIYHAGAEFDPMRRKMDVPRE
ncbi:hypothetical protein TruAng_004981 [Truncatella angustata]|nr:hypothetical protein TruAng_004981 [Truncatella angustata]